MYALTSSIAYSGKSIIHIHQGWFIGIKSILRIHPWWRHQIKTIYVPLAPYAGNPPVTGGFPNKGQWHGPLMFSLICTWTNGWANNRDAGDLRHYGAHYDDTVMSASEATLKDMGKFEQHKSTMEHKKAWIWCPNFGDFDRRCFIIIPFSCHRQDSWRSWRWHTCCCSFAPSLGNLVHPRFRPSWK